MRSLRPIYAKSEIEKKVIAQQSSDLFKEQFHHASQNLVFDLISKIREALANYEIENPAGQDYHVVYCLYSLKRETDYIEKLPSAALDDVREQYFALAGMLWVYFGKVDNEYNQTLAQTVLGVLDQHPLAEADSKVAYSAMREKWKTQLPDLLTYRCQLEDDYRHACRLLYRSLKKKRSHEPNYISKGDDVLFSIQRLKAEQDKAMPLAFDIKYYTAVLKNTKALVEEPHNVRLQKDYAVLVKYCKDEKSSRGLKVAGAMLVFLGGVIAAGCVGLKIASLGVAAPLTTLGIFGGVAAIGLGCVLYKGGKESGPRKRMNALSAAAAKTSNSVNQYTKY